MCHKLTQKSKTGTSRCLIRHKTIDVVKKDDALPSNSSPLLLTYCVLVVTKICYSNNTIIERDPHSFQVEIICEMDRHGGWSPPSRYVRYTTIQ